MDVLIAHNLASERLALKRLLEQDPELKVVGEATELERLLPQVQKNQPDLVLLSWELVSSQKRSVLRALHCPSHPVRVVVFGARAQARREALQAGADGFVSRHEPAETLLNTVRSVGQLSPCFV